MKQVPSFLFHALVVVMLSGISDSAESRVEREQWGVVAGKPVYLHTLSNENGMILKMTNFGAKITAVLVPDSNGQLEDVVLGYDTLDQYVEPNQSLGATIGRFSNRIRNGQFVIDGVTYQLTANEGPNNIHGGGEFENVVWESEVVTRETGIGIRFRYFSPDGSNGFPGNLESTVTYLLTGDNAVYITFEAEADRATHVNFTQHSYFNLNGVKEPILDHIARIDADRYLVMDGVLATGQIESLDGKAWDLRNPTRLGDRMEQIPLGGYHHNYVANKPEGELARVAEVYDPQSGRTLKVSTTQPGVVFYTAMGLTTDIIGKYGIRYGPYMAFCLETQHHIDAPNYPEFPSTLLRPGDKYHETVIYEFGVRRP